MRFDGVWRLFDLRLGCIGDSNFRFAGVGVWALNGFRVEGVCLFFGGIAFEDCTFGECPRLASPLMEFSIVAKRNGDKNMNWL